MATQVTYSQLSRYMTFTERQAQSLAENYGLDDKQLIFVAEYVATGNRRRAAAAAEIKPLTADKWLTLRSIQAAIEAARIRIQVRTEITVDKILRELGVIAFSDVRHFVIGKNGKLELADGAPEIAWRAVQSVKYTPIKGVLDRYQVELRLWSKPEALALIGKHLGMFVERIANPDGSPIDWAAALQGGRKTEEDLTAASEYLDMVKVAGSDTFVPHRGDRENRETE
jgi:hypothetical protein